MPLSLKVFPGIAYAADAATRRDAVSGLVVNERDYVSSWLATVRNMWRMLGGAGYCQTLPAHREQRMGCDGLIVLQGAMHYKYIYFEAKRLRARFDGCSRPTNTAYAEYGVGAPVTTRYSHFSDQIGRQAQWLAAHQDDVIVEMFLNFEEIMPLLGHPPFDLHGSSIVQHNVARSHVLPSALVRPHAGAINVTDAWQIADVSNICAIQRQSIQSVLDNVVACNLGLPVRYGALPAGYEAFPVIGNAEQPFQLQEFLAVMGVRHFAHFVGEFPFEDRRNVIPD